MSGVAVAENRLDRGAALAVLLAERLISLIGYGTRSSFGLYLEPMTGANGWSREMFSQVMDHLPMKTFRRCVERYHGNRYVQSFTCLDQFLCMAFAQLTFRESLRDIEVCLRAHHDKLYHMGIRGGMSRNTLLE